MVGPRRIKIGIITASIASQCELLSVIHMYRLR